MKANNNNMPLLVSSSLWKVQELSKSSFQIEKAEFLYKKWRKIKIFIIIFSKKNKSNYSILKQQSKYFESISVHPI